MMAMDPWTQDILFSHRPGNLLRIQTMDQVVEGRVFFDDENHRLRIENGFDQQSFIPYDSLYKGARVERLND